MSVKKNDSPMKFAFIIMGDFGIDGDYASVDL